VLRLAWGRIHRGLQIDEWPPLVKLDHVMDGWE